MANMHEVDYEILGDDMQFVKIELDPGEAAVGEAGAMMYMEDGIEVQTIFGDGTQQPGGVMASLPDVAARTTGPGWSREETEAYLRGFHYRFGPDELQGLARFEALLREHGLIAVD